MHAEFPFQVHNEAVDGAGVERIAADEKRVEAERDAQAGVADVLFYDAGDAPIAGEADEMRENPRHVRPRAEGFVGKFLKTDFVNGFA